MNRTLRYASRSHQSLRNNSQHQLAASHALQLYRTGAVYSFIPKNACSTLRLTLALENGCIQDPADHNWIHKNNDAFTANLPALINASYTFVVLRCPFARIASAFLDKIVGHTLDAWQVHDAIQRSRNIGTFTFDFFVKTIASSASISGNIHWRSQMDFLVYQEYDDYFCLEQFGHAIKTLQRKIAVSVVDARKLTEHGLDNFEIIQDQRSYAHVSALEIMNLKAAGMCPSPRSLFSPELVEIVRKHYQDDIDFYVQKFGEENLLFPARATSACVQAPLDAPAKPWNNKSSCNICGGELIDAHASLAANMEAPSCGSCGALFAHRVARHFIHALPCGLLGSRRGLQIGLGQAISQTALRSLQSMPAEKSTFDDLANQATGSFDFLAVCAECLSQAEGLPERPAVFAQLSRLLSDYGLMLVDFGALDSQTVSRETQAACVEQNLSSMALQAIDPCTGLEMTLHLFCKKPELLDKIKSSQLVWHNARAESPDHN